MSTRIPLVVFVNLDAIPGTMHTEASARAVVQAILGDRLGAYKPNVVIPNEPMILDTTKESN